MKTYRNEKHGFEIDLPEEWDPVPAVAIGFANILFGFISKSPKDDCFQYGCAGEAFNFVIGPLFPEHLLDQTEREFSLYAQNMGFKDVVFGRILVGGKEHVCAHYNINDKMGRRWNQKYILVFGGIEYAITGTCNDPQWFARRKQDWDLIIQSFRLLIPAVAAEPLAENENRAFEQSREIVQESIDVKHLYANTVKTGIQRGLIILAFIFGLLCAVLFLQSIHFASSIRVLIEFGFGEWEIYLSSMLRSLVIWAIVTGMIFSIQFFISLPGNNSKKTLSDAAIGFIIGFIFTYLLVFVLGIIIYIPLGIISIFRTEIIKFATLAYGWLVAAYIIFIFIVIDTPRMLFHVIKEGNLYFKLLGILMAALLVVQTLKALSIGLLILLKNSTWRTNPALLALGIALLVTIIANILLIRREEIHKVIFAIIMVYIAAIITGNVAYSEFRWGEISALILACFIAPIVYSFVAKKIIHSGTNAIAGIWGLIGGVTIGLLIDQYTKLRIIGQGWFGILCGTILTIGFGIAFGLLWGPAISNFLVNKARIRPITGFRIGAGLFLGIIVGMVSGGFLTR